MLPRRNRIPGNIFPTLFRRGRRMRGTFATIIALKSGGTRPQCACVAPKRVAKSAVARNTLRRRCYQALQPIYKDLPKGSVAVFVLQDAAKNASLSEFESEFKTMLRNVLNTPCE